jgi:hypothetical protein
VLAFILVRLFCFPLPWFAFYVSFFALVLSVGLDGSLASCAQDKTRQFPSYSSLITSVSFFWLVKYGRGRGKGKSKRKGMRKGYGKN